MSHYKDKDKRRTTDNLRADRYRSVLDRYKRRKGCIDCGYKADPKALQFDHVKGEKRRTVASLCYAGWRPLKAEIAKCVVRCCNCHAIKTFSHKQQGREAIKLARLRKSMLTEEVDYSLIRGHN